MPDLSVLAPALRHRNFRLYFAGQAVSVIGSWIQTVAISWTIFKLTNSSSLLGLAAFLIQGPQLVLTPFAGVLVDRYSRRRMLIAVQVLNCILSFALGCLVVADALQPMHLLVASAILGILNSFDTPLRQSLLAFLIDEKRDLPSAIALNASIFTTGRFIGPPVAGVLLGALPASVCFFANGLSFLGLIVALGCLRMPVPDRQVDGHSGLIEALMEGFSHVKDSPGISRPLALLASVNLTASSALVIAPVFASHVFQGATETLGWLLGAAGAGAVVGTTFLARNHAMAHVALLLLRAPVACLVGMTMLALSTRWEMAMPAMFMIGVGIAITNVATNALLQTAVSENLRGRVISFFAAVRFGMDALGGLIAGVITSFVGPAFAISTEMLVLFSAFVFLAPKIRAMRRELATVRTD